MEGDTPTPVSPRRRYAPWAMAAIVSALLALLLQGALLPLNLAAAVMALLGLRQIRREPERYIGRPFCWLAIALVLILAVLTAMLEPTPSVPPAEYMVPDEAQQMPDEGRAPSEPVADER
ncbi:hypothetical protein [Halomonas sp. JS92-SW72]|uniref:hypothetical protein n=1 Tax=Halomonas sp. JS92-SW72 TaxID=2306583 RepID=UPI000E5C0024|nr:hypothetical protein [Halomonas sp. JS92-SW72]AXY40844.1 hypothetical protein D1793_00730 [Halomonas sp. JS92-SW72]